jgi:hypothetical protein
VTIVLASTLAGLLTIARKLFFARDFDRHAQGPANRYMNAVDNPGSAEKSNLGHLKEPDSPEEEPWRFQNPRRYNKLRKNGRLCITELRLLDPSTFVPLTALLSAANYPIRLLASPSRSGRSAMFAKHQTDD